MLRPPASKRRRLRSTVASSPLAPRSRLINVQRTHKLGCITKVGALTFFKKQNKLIARASATLSGACSMRTSCGSSSGNPPDGISDRVPARGHDGPVTVLQQEYAHDPVLVPPASRPEGALVIVKDAPVAHDETTSGGAFEFPKGGDAILTGHRSTVRGTQTGLP